jgi:hypothetical protein
VNNLRGLAVFGWLLLLCGSLVYSAAASTVEVIQKKQVHLRSGVEPEWEEFKKRIPSGKKMEVRFISRANDTEQTLFIEQRDVKLDWPVRLNGTNLGKLFLMEAPLVWSMPIPAGKLRDGENVLTISPPKENDDVVLGPIWIDQRPVHESADGWVKVEVREDGRPVPSRITVARSDGMLAALQTPKTTALSPTLSASRPGEQRVAARPGVVYTADGRAEVGLLAGTYVIMASRGPEYSLATKKIKVRRGERVNVTLEIRREVPTAGWISCDTHVHTWTFSRHGDATLDERMLTIAGEAIELPVATDHNVIVDYALCAQSNKVAQYFTPVTGDEVTTSKGHFNAFPIRAGGVPPDFKQDDWATLMKSIRATPGVEAVILNHPTDTHSGFCPFALTNFNRVTGENLRGGEFSFDGMELVNSGALRTDLMETFRGWFALLNYGYRVTGVGASDSHDVSRFIVGQGRTYIQGEDKDVGAIDIDQAVGNLRAGKALISLGLIAKMRVDDRFGVGDLATKVGETLKVMVEVLGPSWSKADRVELFANGTRIREARVGATKKIQKAALTWKIPTPPHDVYLVAVASGPGITSPHWAIPRPYQPSSPHWESRILGATNPIWVDADGDGEFTPPREYAGKIVKQVGTGAAVLEALRPYDEAVAAQCASLCLKAGEQIDGAEFRQGLRRAPIWVQRGFSNYLASVAGRATIRAR